MKHPRKPPESGILIDNTLSMALHRRTPPRPRWILVLLTLAGALGNFLTFLTMFSPPLYIGILTAWVTVITVFFCWHAAHPGGQHVTLLVFLLGCGLYFWIHRTETAAGMMALMNAMYQTIYQTDWAYFTIPDLCTTEEAVTDLMCFAAVPIVWLLSYAVMRYQNFFLALLVTFPFVEVGLFFGIAPEHAPAALLFAFWVGMGAVQLSGAGSLQVGSRSGFVRRGESFVPVPSMRFLMTEHAGALAALLAVVIFLGTDAVLAARNYERPQKVKQMREDFLLYTASIDWSDMSTVFPFLRSSHPRDEDASLGKSDRRQFDNVRVSSICFDRPPQGRVYLRFAGYTNYDRDRWTRADVTSPAYHDPIFTACTEVGAAPMQMLGTAMAEMAPNDTAHMTLIDPDETLARCVPYAYRPTPNVTAAFDDIGTTSTRDYDVYAGIDYDYLFLSAPMHRVDDSVLLSMAPSYDQEHVLAALLEGMPPGYVWAPHDMGAGFAEDAVLCRGGYTAFARSQYLDVPQTQAMELIRRGFADLFQDYDAQTASPAETMAVLSLMRDRLCANVTYSLAPGKTPSDRDFLAYFLLENKKGYCEHYATAGTILARMAGIPARYCEGYLIDPASLTESGGVWSAEVLDSCAHAWTEIYLEGYGWMPFEFTFSYFVSPVVVIEETSEVTETVPPTEPATTSPPPTDAPDAPTAPTADPDIAAGHMPDPHIWIAIVVVTLGIAAVIGGFVLARERALRRRERALRQKDTRAAAEYAWRRLLVLLTERGANIHTVTVGALTDEVLAKATPLLDEETLCTILDIGTRLRYSPHPPTREELARLARAGDHLAKAIYDEAKPPRRFVLKWLRHYL